MRGIAMPQKLITEVIFEDFACNLRCKYCLAPLRSIPIFNGVHTIQRNGKIIELNASSNTELGDRMRRSIEKALSIDKTPVLKIIGGEVFLFKYFTEFISEIVSFYELILITTNGTLLDQEKTEKLNEFGNIVIQMSLDGHLFEMNSYRVPNQHLNDRLMENLKQCFNKRIRVEIQLVLHDRNIKLLSEFLDYLLPYADKGCYVKVIPFPVKWTQDRYQPPPETYERILKIINDYERWRCILPPQAYLQNLYDFLINGRRTSKCYVPNFLLGIDNLGKIHNCTCIPSAYVTIDDEYSEIIDKIKKEQDFCYKRKILSGLCTKCFDQWEYLNAYLQGYVSDEELKSMAIGKTKNALLILHNTKNEVTTDDALQGG
jgi:MoaA/NifB/PqqE/SkfB family radical SAM enzyme